MRSKGITCGSRKPKDHSACDYTFHMSVTKFEEQTEGQLREIVADGIASFKIFLAYKNFFGVDDGEMYQTLDTGQEAGRDRHRALRKCRTGRPPAAESARAGQNRTRVARAEPSGIRRSRRHQSFRHVPREPPARPAMSSISPAKRALEAALAAKVPRRAASGSNRCLPHLLLDKTYAERPGVEGMKHVMSPPLRDRRNQKVLWDALAAGSIDTVGTDHCPFDTSQKLLGKDAFTQIPNGIPGIEERVSLLYTYGVKRGTLDLHRFVDAASTRAAKLFGLFPRKGTIAVGSDADLVIYDPEYRGKHLRRNAAHQLRLQRI